MTVERCAECGFDGQVWTDAAAIDAIGGLPIRWRESVANLRTDELRRRPLAQMWSISEYADHVREVLFGMRFLLDTAVAQPGTVLGDPPEPRFDPEPRAIDIDVALAGIDHEATALRDRLNELPASAWQSTVQVGDDEVDVHWVARHAVHDATHHLGDIERLRAALR